MKSLFRPQCLMFLFLLLPAKFYGFVAASIRGRWSETHPLYGPVVIHLVKQVSVLSAFSDVCCFGGYHRRSEEVGRGSEVGFLQQKEALFLFVLIDF